ncbi:MAG: NUDIX hydrolase [Halieaceae bacterium]|nr:NUDIX hydrolase [Halieaceae bacterium]
MTRWSPNATVATVIIREHKYLLVEERDKSTGKLVYNQPAGHLEEGETLTAAAVRETREETGWDIELSGVLGLTLYTAPSNGISYLRTTFVGEALNKIENATLDPDILAAHWLDYEEILAISAKMRSPLVLESIERHRRGLCYPLDLLYNK